MSNIFLVFALIFGICGIVSAIVMADFISKRGHKINFLLFKLYLFKYIHQYREITLKEEGKVGVWFYRFIISMNLALVCVIIGVILK